MNNLSPINNNLNQTQFTGHEHSLEALNPVREINYNTFANQLCKEFPELDQLIRQAVQRMFLDHMHDLTCFKACVMREIHSPEDVQLKIIKMASEVFQLDNQTAEINAQEMLPSKPKDDKPIKLLNVTEELPNEVATTTSSINFNAIEDLIELAGLESEVEVTAFFKELHAVIISGQKAAIQQAFPSEQSVFLLVKMLKNSNVVYAELAFECLLELVKLEHYGQLFFQNERIDECITFMNDFNDAKMVKNKFVFLEVLMKHSFAKSHEVHDYIATKILLVLTLHLNAPDPIAKKGSLEAIACLRMEEIDAPEAIRDPFYWALGSEMAHAPSRLEFLQQGGLLKILSILNAKIEVYVISTADDQLKLAKTILFVDRTLQNLLIDPINCLNLPLESILTTVDFQLKYGRTKLKVWAAGFLGVLFTKLKSEEQILMGEKSVPTLVELLNQDFSVQDLELTDEKKAELEQRKMDEDSLADAARFSLHKFASNPKILTLIVEQNTLDILHQQLSLSANTKILKNVLRCLGVMLPDNCLDQEIKDMPFQLQDIYKKIMECLSHPDQEVLAVALRAFYSLVIRKKLALPKSYAPEAIPLLTKLAWSPNVSVAELSWWVLGNLVLKGIKDESTAEELLQKIEKNIFLDANQHPNVVEGASFCYLNMFEKAAVDSEPVLKNQVDESLNLLMTSTHAKVQEGMLWKLHKMCDRNPIINRYLTQKGFDRIADLLDHADDKIALGALWVFGRLAFEYKKMHGTMNTPVIENAMESLLSQLLSKNENVQRLAARCLGTLCANESTSACCTKVVKSEGISLLSNLMKETKSDVLVEILTWILVTLSSKGHVEAVVENLGEKFISLLIDKNISKISEGVLFILAAFKESPEWVKMHVEKILALRAQHIKEGLVNENKFSDSMEAIKSLSRFLKLKKMKFDDASSLAKLLLNALTKNNRIEGKNEIAKLLLFLMLSGDEKFEEDLGMAIYKHCTPSAALEILEYLRQLINQDEAFIPSELLMNSGIMALASQHAEHSADASFVLTAARKRSEAMNYWEEHFAESDLNKKIYEDLVVNTPEEIFNKKIIKFMDQVSREIPNLDKTLYQAVGFMILNNNLTNFTVCVKREIQSPELQELIIDMAMQNFS